MVNLLICQCLHRTDGSLILNSISVSYRCDSLLRNCFVRSYAERPFVQRSRPTVGRSPGTITFSQVRHTPCHTDISWETKSTASAHDPHLLIVHSPTARSASTPLLPPIRRVESRRYNQIAVQLFAERGAFTVRQLIHAMDQRTVRFPPVSLPECFRPLIDAHALLDANAMKC